MNYSSTFECYVCVLYVSVFSPELEELLMEGLLLQVTLPELQSFYQALLSCCFPSQCALQSSEHDHQYHIAQDSSLTCKSSHQATVLVSMLTKRGKHKSLERDLI